MGRSTASTAQLTYSSRPCPPINTTPAGAFARSGLGVLGIKNAALGILDAAYIRHRRYSWDF